MKYALYLFSFIMIVGLTSYNTPEEQLLSTKLRITVIDELGNPIEGATVTLYKSEAEYRANENEVQSAETDKKGRVTFKELEPIAYYMDARMDDKNNNGAGVVTAELEEGKLNKVNTVIE